MTKTYILKYIALIILFCISGLTACKQKNVQKGETKEDTTAGRLKKALTFYASFDTGVNADFSVGDSLMYNVPNRNDLDSSKVVLHKPDISSQEGKGK